jgi:uncharacterized protein (TIGR02996 family)
MGRQFQRAICEAPYDDTPRLIYADWLDENGWGQQAEFIRIGLRLATAGSNGRSLSREERRLYRRTEVLLRPNEREWTWPFCDLGEGRSWSCGFARGFLCDIRMAAGDFIANAAAIFSLHPVTEVHFPRTGAFYGTTFFDGSMTGRGRKAQRIPGALFPFLAEAGAPCAIRGSTAEFTQAVWNEDIRSRAAVAFGRRQAGLPGLAWPEQEEGHD